jgi:hypothetical protein
MNLTKISTNAFNLTADHFVELDLVGKNQSGKEVKIKELFELFSSLTNFKKLNTNLETFDKIPENAFKNKQINLMGPLRFTDTRFTDTTIH